MNLNSSSKQLTPNISSSKLDNVSSTHKKKEAPNNPNYIPFLRKNNKTTHLFGLAYYNSVKEAIFEIPCKPFIPPDIPESFKIDTELQSLYVCGQCRDCFRFSRSLEEHTARRSWILGYWCQHCFQIKCLHVPKGRPMCSGCLSSQFYKRAYLRTKGMKKGQRAAIIRLFYNQCQFFEHLKAHNITSVEINDLMLMPLPSDVKNEDYPKLEKACKSLMEYGFLNRIHIMDFLREQKTQDDWWNPPSLDPNIDKSEVEYNVAGIINTYRESDLIDKMDNSVKKNNLSNKNSPSANKNNSAGDKNLNSNQSNSSSSLANNHSGLYFHSSFHPPTDIAFVDCGPSHSVCKSNQAKTLPYSSPQTTKKSDFLLKNKNVSGLFNKQNSQSSYQSPTTSVSISASCSSSNKIYTVSTSNTNGNTGPKISVKKFASEPAANWGQLRESSEKSTNQPQPANANTKILTVHSEKCLDLTSIISKLPPDVMNSKKIVFIEQNSNQVQYQKSTHGNKNAIHMSPIPSLSANCIRLVPQRRLVSKEKDTSNNPIPILPALSTPQVKQVLPSVFKNMSKPSFSTNSESKVKTFTMSAVPKPILKTVSLDQKTSSSNNISSSPSGVKLEQINTYDGKIFYQSGKKYVIKPANKIKSPSVPTNSVLKSTTQIAKKIQVSTSASYTVTKTVSKPLQKILPKPTNILPSSVSSLTPSPSPSPSEQSSNSSCDAQVKQVMMNSDDDIEKSFSVTKSYKNLGLSSLQFDLRNLPLKEQKLLLVKYDATGKPFLYMCKNTQAIVKNISSTVTRYRQGMLDTLPYLNKDQIKSRIEHVKQISEDYSRVMQIVEDKIILEHRRLITCLEDSIEQAKLLSIGINADEECQKMPEINENFCTLDNWEEQELQKCPFCEKMKKPSSYLPGFSKLSRDESRYCQCYNCQCNHCNTFQGNLSRFAAHINYHEKNNPYTCPECLKKFSSFDLLEKHVWLNCFHPLIKNWMLGCKVCGIEGLTTIESLTRHFLIMHSERGFVCSECKRVFLSNSECRKHYKSDHQKGNSLDREVRSEKDMVKYTMENEVISSKNLSDPVEIIMCKVGRCIVLKESLKNHLLDHTGVEEQIFYKCPFCPFSKRESKGVKELFRDHILSNHNHVLSQCTNFKTWSIVQETLKKLKSNNEEILPMIINTRTIAQEAFEKGTQDEEIQNQDQNLLNEKSILELPLIVDVRSEAVNLNSTINNNNLAPKILEVKSIAKDSILDELKSSKSRKRKSSSVSEMTVLPEKMFSMEVIKDKVDERIVASEIANSPNMMKNCTEREQFVERELSIVNGNNIDKKNIVNKENTVLEINSTVNEDSFLNEERSLSSANALDDLKAKMSRTFKTLAKKMEATTTTLQHEYSKSLPKLTNISEVMENISKVEFNLKIGRSGRINESFKADENVKSVESAGLDKCDKTEDNSVLDVNLRTDIVPPPLSRIPGYVFNSQPIVEHEQSFKKTKKRKHIEKIAFNGPSSYKEQVLDFKCHVCNEMIDSSWPILKSHFEMWHRDEYKVFVLNPQLLRITSDYIEGGYKEVLAKKYKCDSVPRKRKRRSRFSTKTTEKVFTDKSAGICITTEPVEEDDGTFKCKKCNLKWSDMGSLREHISKNHRIKGRYLVCLECGENFVVAPSLQMHLKAFHAIDDPLTYLLQNTAFAPENMEDTEEEEEEVTTEANQCYVCMAVFENKAAVDKHLRVHGMAFLNRKRIEARKSLNSSEKQHKTAAQMAERSQNINTNLKPDKLQRENQELMTESAVMADSLETEVSGP